MKKLLSLCTALVLALALAVPASADMGYTPLNSDPEWLAWREAWIAEHPEEYAAFDPDLWFEQHYESYDSMEDFMARGEIPTREEFEAHMVQDWLEHIRYAEGQYPRAEAYAAAYPEEYAAFDPDAWAERSWHNTREGYRTMWQVDDETFVRHMWNEYAIPAALPEKAQAWADAHPEEVERFLHEEIEAFAAVYSYAPIADTARDWGTGEDYVRRVVLNLWVERSLYEAQEARFAGFDAGAWFSGYYSLLGLTPEDYMRREDLDAEGFRRRMFTEWAEQERGFYGGCCVTVNGVPVQFQLYRDLDLEIAAPRWEDGLLLVPVRPAAEYLGLTVDYLPEQGRITCTGEAGTVWFDLDRPAYSGGVLDTAPRAVRGITYLPLRDLAEALGCSYDWDPDFSTAALAAPARP